MSGSAINFETFPPWGRQFGQGLIFGSGKYRVITAVKGSNRKL